MTDINRSTTVGVGVRVGLSISDIISLIVALASCGVWSCGDIQETGILSGAGDSDIVIQ